MKRFGSVDDYIAGSPEPARGLLKAMRAIIKAEAPQAEEKLSYGMPYYSLGGRLIYIGAFRDHVSLFPASRSAVEHFKAELAAYKTSAGTIQFPLDKPLPRPLIRKVVRFRVAENRRKNK